MQRILKLLHEHPEGLTPNAIANKTELLTEIQLDRLYKYLSELEWCGILIHENNIYKLPPWTFSTPHKTAREREKKKKREELSLKAGKNKVKGLDGKGG